MSEQSGGMTDANNTQSNETLTSLWSSYIEAEYIYAVQAGWVTCALTVVQLGIWCFMAVQESIEEKYKRRVSVISTAFRPINLLLLLLILSNYFPLLCFQMQAQGNDSIVEDIAWNIVGNIFSTLFNTAAILITWTRGCAIADIAAKWSIPCCRAVIFLFLLLQVVCCVLNTYLAVNDVTTTPLEVLYQALFYLNFASDILFSTLDLFLAIVFIRYLRNAIHEKLETTDGRMSILARYGIASFCCFQLVMISTVAFSYANAPEIPPVTLEVFLALFNLQLYAPLPYILAVLAMKWALLTFKKRKQTESASLENTRRGLTKQLT
ncbi:hypothetical protein BC830DRAFT_487947 [Chytriomyces sp. MP71]|nr:hypothetical protein BC830DRAFT_487947 [Chytriomyces sp. MP71]